MKIPMNLLAPGFSAALRDAQPPCVSLYQTTRRHRPDNSQDPIRFRNLVKQAEQSLKRDFPDAASGEIIEKLNAIAADVQFWNHTLDGLVIFAAQGVFEVITTQRPVDELLVVAESFHTKPLRRQLQTADRFQVLGLTRRTVRMFEGNRDRLDEIDLAPGVPKTLEEALGHELTDPHLTVASYGGVGVNGAGPAMVHGHGDKSAEVDIDDERFFRVVAKAVQEHHSQPSGLPLILAALPEHHALFHRVNHNPALVEEGVRINPDAINADGLRDKAWEVIGSRYQEMLDSFSEDFGQARAKGLASDSLEQVAQAAADGRVDSLLIEAGKHLPGHLDPDAGAIQPAPDATGVDDLLDDLGDLVESRGGKVRVVPQERMPSKAGVAAIFRY